MGNEHDTIMRIKRAARTWMQIKKRFMKCKLNKKTQAKVVETCVESTTFFKIGDKKNSKLDRQEV